MEGFDEQAWHGLLSRAASANASDIHFAPDAPPFFRVNGTLTQFAEAENALTEREISSLLSSWMTAEQRERFRTLGEIDFAREETDFRLRLRVHGSAVRGGTALSVRLVPERIPAGFAGRPACLSAAFVASLRTGSRLGQNGRGEDDDAGGVSQRNFPATRGAYHHTGGSD